MRPTKITILSRTWTVTYKPKIDNDGHWGECDHENQELSIKDEMNLEQEQSTLLHECIHAISESLGLKLKERQVLCLETGLYDLLVSNPQLLSYLQTLRKKV